jgi:hypothetical protein
MNMMQLRRTRRVVYLCVAATVAALMANHSAVKAAATEVGDDYMRVISHNMQGASGINRKTTSSNTTTSAVQTMYSETLQDILGYKPQIFMLQEVCYEHQYNGYLNGWAQTNNYTLGFATSRIENSACLNQAEIDHLTSVQGTPAPGSSVCEDYYEIHGVSDPDCWFGMVLGVDTHLAPASSVTFLSYPIGGSLYDDPNIHRSFHLLCADVAVTPKVSACTTQLRNGRSADDGYNGHGPLYWREQQMNTVLTQLTSRYDESVRHLVAFGGDLNSWPTDADLDGLYRFDGGTGVFFEADQTDSAFFGNGCGQQTCDTCTGQTSCRSGEDTNGPDFNSGIAPRTTTDRSKASPTTCPEGSCRSYISKYDYIFFGAKAPSGQGPELNHFSASCQKDLYSDHGIYRGQAIFAPLSYISNVPAPLTSDYRCNEAGYGI